VPPSITGASLLQRKRRRYIPIGLLVPPMRANMQAMQFISLDGRQWDVINYRVVNRAR
jgi:hypothetical protein